MSFKDKICSYLTYLFTGGGAIEAKAYASTPDLSLGGAKMISEHAARTIAETPWLYDMFPDLVESGVIIVRDGHFYMFGLAWTDVLTNTLATVSFLVLFWRTYYDVRRIKRDSVEGKK